MSEQQTVTLTIPTPIFDHLKRRAEAGNRSVQDEIIETLLSTVPIPEAFPPELTAALAPLALLNDEELWQAGRSRLSTEEATQLESLHHKRGRVRLSDEEERTVDGLMRRYERLLLVRAEAAALLKQRGHDVSVLLAVGAA